MLRRVTASHKKLRVWKTILFANGVSITASINHVLSRSAYIDTRKGTCFFISEIDFYNLEIIWKM